MDTLLTLIGHPLPLLLPVLLTVAAASDLARYEIPNRYAITLLACWPLLVLTGTQPDWAAGLITGAVLFGLSLALWWFRLLGGGDVKLLGAAGLWLGWPSAGTFLVVMSLAGGLLAGLLLLLRREAFRAALPQQGPMGAMLTNLTRREEGIPYAAAMALAGWFVFPGWLTFLTPG